MHVIQFMGARCFEFDLAKFLKLLLSLKTSIYYRNNKNKLNPCLKVHKVVTIIRGLLNPASHFIFFKFAANSLAFVNPCIQKVHKNGHNTLRRFWPRLAFSFFFVANSLAVLISRISGVFSACWVYRRTMDGSLGIWRGFGVGINCPVNLGKW